MPPSLTAGYFDAADTLLDSHMETLAPSLGWDSDNRFLATGFVGDSVNVAR